MKKYIYIIQLFVDLKTTFHQLQWLISRDLTMKAAMIPLRLIRHSSSSAAVLLHTTAAAGLISLPDGESVSNVKRCYRWEQFKQNRLSSSGIRTPNSFVDTYARLNACQTCLWMCAWVCMCAACMRACTVYALYSLYIYSDEVDSNN